MRGTFRARGFSFALVLGSVHLVSTRSDAQGAPPAVSELVVDPENEQHLALRSNYGLWLSHDAGNTWDFRCKAGMGYEGSAEPALAILPKGTLALGVATGVERGDAAGCDFAPSTGIQGNVVAVAPLPRSSDGALAVTVSFKDSSSKVWQSLDDAKSFQPLSAGLSHFTALSMATTESHRVYITGLRWGASVSGAFGISRDGGRTFAIKELPDSDSGSQPFIAAIDRENPDTVYLRFSGTPGKLKLSEDAGDTFREVLSLPGPIQGFALDKAGHALIVSGLEVGTYVANTGSLDFKRVACEGVPCLAATKSGLLACGQSKRNGFIVGRSLDAGQTFQPLLDEPCVKLAQCGAKTAVASKCAQGWPTIAGLLGQRAAACGSVVTNKPSNRACFERAGTTTPDAVSRAAATVPSVTAMARSRTASNRSGCHCALSRVPELHQRSRSTLALFMVAGAWAYRRRRRRAGTSRWGVGSFCCSVVSRQ